MGSSLRFTTFLMFAVLTNGQSTSKNAPDNTQTENNQTSTVKTDTSQTARTNSVVFASTTRKSLDQNTISKTPTTTSAKRTSGSLQASIAISSSFDISTSPMQITETSFGKETSDITSIQSVSVVISLNLRTENSLKTTTSILNTATDIVPSSSSLPTTSVILPIPSSSSVMSMSSVGTYMSSSVLTRASVLGVETTLATRINTTATSSVVKIPSSVVPNTSVAVVNDTAWSISRVRKSTTLIPMVTKTQSFASTLMANGTVMSSSIVNASKSSMSPMSSFNVTSPILNSTVMSSSNVTSPILNSTMMSSSNVTLLISNSTMMSSFVNVTASSMLTSTVTSSMLASTVKSSMLGSTMTSSMLTSPVTSPVLTSPVTTSIPMTKVGVSESLAVLNATSSSTILKHTFSSTAMHDATVTTVNASTTVRQGTLASSSSVGSTPEANFPVSSVTIKSSFSGTSSLSLPMSMMSSKTSQSVIMVPMTSVSKTTVLGSVTPKPADDDEQEGNTAMIIYIVFGVVLGLAFLIGVVALIMRCHHERTAGMFYLANEEQLELSGFTGANKAHFQPGNFYGELEMESGEPGLGSGSNEPDRVLNGDTALDENRDDGSGGFGGGYLPEWKNLPTVDLSEAGRAEDESSTSTNLLLTYGNEKPEKENDLFKAKDSVGSYDNPSIDNEDRGEGKVGLRDSNGN